MYVRATSSHTWFSWPVYNFLLKRIINSYQTLETVFERITKRLEACLKYFAGRRNFNCLLGVWKCGEVRSLVFDISHQQ